MTIQLDSSRKRRLAEIIFLALISSFTLFWFLPGKQIIGVDTLLPTNLDYFLREYSSVWSSKIFGGFFDTNKLALLSSYIWILQIIQYLKISFSPTIFQQFLTYILFFSGNLSVWLLYNYLFPKSSTVGRIFSTICYSFSIYALYLYTAFPISLIIGFSFFPLILYLSFKLFDNPNLRSSILFAILWFLLLNPTYGTPPYLLIHIFIVTIGFIFKTIWSKKYASLKAAKYFLLSFLIWLLMSLYWFVPWIGNIKQDVKELTSSSQQEQLDYFHLNSTSPLESFRSAGYFGFTDSASGAKFYPWFGYFQKPFNAAISYFPFMLFIIGLISKRGKNKQYIYCATMFATFIFLVKGPNDPLGDINTAFYRLLNLFSIFRTGYQRFTGFSTLFLALSSGYTLDFLCKSLCINNKKINKNFIILGIVIITLITKYQFISGKIFDSDRPLSDKRVSIPQSYLKLESLIQNNNCHGILPVPIRTYGLANFNWNEGKDGYDGVYPFGMITSGRFVTYTQKNVNWDKMFEFDSSSTLASYYASLGIDCVIFHKDTNWDYVKKSNGWLPDPNFIDTPLKFDSVIGLTRVEDNNNYSFYSLDQNIREPLIKVVATDSNKTILSEYKQINVTNYILTIKATKLETVSVLLKEQYHPGWKIIGEISKKFAFSSVHENEESENKWTIDLAKYCQEFSDNCSKDAQNNFQILLSLIFTPQWQIDSLLKISRTTLYAMLVIYLGFSFYRKK